MHVKSFFLGAFFGAAVLAAADWLLFDDRQTGGDDAAATDADLAMGTAGFSEAPAPERLDETGQSVGGDPIDVAESVATDESGPPPNEEDATTDTPDTATEDQVVRDVSYYLDQRRKELMAEPKDHSWAYYMEQTITQFLARHPGMVEFDLTYVECRRVTCQVQVVGYGQDAYPTWAKISHDMHSQLPDAFYSSGWSGFDLDGRPVYVHKLIREEP